MELISGVVRHYDWGSRTAIPELLGQPATGEPWAELWLGAHPAAPAEVGARAEPLDRLIAADPVAALGPAVASRYGRLPFMVKVLAAAEPLSLQAHPTQVQAAAGFAREEADGIGLDAPERMFTDRSPKPEMICALSSFETLCGFRSAERTDALLESLEAPALAPLRGRLANRATQSMRDVLEWLLCTDEAVAAELADAVTEACVGVSVEDEWTATRTALGALGTLRPGDRGVAMAVLLNHVALAPGEAVFLDSGCLHAHLGGTAVEVMADSDNVVRGGLTSKHTDAATLLQIVDCEASDAPVQAPELAEGVAVYSSTAPQFSLLRAEVDAPVELPAGPAVLLCTAGRVDASGVAMHPGTAAWAPASDPRVVLEGQGTVFCAMEGEAAKPNRVTQCLVP